MDVPAFEERNPTAFVIRPSSLLCAVRTVWFVTVVGCQLGRTNACLLTGTVASTSVIWYYFPSSFLKAYMSVKLICFQGLFPACIFFIQIFHLLLEFGKKDPSVGLSRVLTAWGTFPSTRGLDLTKNTQAQGCHLETDPTHARKGKTNSEVEGLSLGVLWFSLSPFTQTSTKVLLP